MAKKRNYLITISMLLTTLGFSVFSWGNCDLVVERKVGNRAWAPLVLVLSPGEQRTNLDSQFAMIRKVENRGSTDVEILVKGRGFPHGIFARDRRHTVRAGETYGGNAFRVELKEAQCSQIAQGPRSGGNQANDYWNLADFNPVANLAWQKLGRKRNNCIANMGNRDDQRSVENPTNIMFWGARRNEGKFNHLELTSRFSQVNHYLLSQAASKTYPKQFKYGHDRNGRWLPASNEEEYRCAADELYRHWGFTDVMFANGASGANAIIAEMNDKVVVTVRGTEFALEFQGLADTLANGAGLAIVEASRFQLGRGKVHLGYATAGVELTDLVMQGLRQMNAVSKPIFVTGHSLGGATATVLAHRLARGGLDVQAAYVLAPPKVGDQQFNQTIRRRLPLYVTWNYRDPVPTLPTLGKRGSMPWAGEYAFTFGAARQLNFYRNDHSMLSIPVNTNNYGFVVSTIANEMDSGSDQDPWPEVFLGQHALSWEWHFHHGNFYTAFAYDRFNQLTNEGRSVGEPEFNKDKMCLVNESPRFRTYDWNMNINRLLGDNNGPLIAAGTVQGGVSFRECRL